MLKSSLVISTLIATTIFISPHSLLAGQEATSETSVTTSSAAAKLSIEDQLNRDWKNLSLKLSKWDRAQKEKAAKKTGELHENEIRAATQDYKLKVTVYGSLNLPKK